MNIIRAISMTAIAAMMVGCSIEGPAEKEQSSLKPLTIQASREDAAIGEGPSTKTMRNEKTRATLWSRGDRISLFYGSGSDGGSMFTSTQEEDTVKITNFTGNIGVITGGADIPVDQTYFWALYPYDPTAECDGKSITFSLPSNQEAVPSTFANNLFPSMGKSQGLIMGFYNICGGFRFSVSKEGVKKATFRGNNGEKLTGRIKASMVDGYPSAELLDGEEEIVLTAPDGKSFEVGKYYYFVMAPTTFESGFTVKVETMTEEATFEYSDAITVTRSNFKSKTNMDNGLEYTLKPDDPEAPCNIIYYTSTDGGIVTPNATDVFGANIVSNEYTDGQGVLTFDGDVTSIGNSTFSFCSGLTSVTIPNSVTSIGNDAFSNCTGLTSVTIPNGVTSIGNAAFSGCTSLTSVTIPDSVTSLGVWAFYHCTSLTGVTIPASVTSIGDHAFTGCESLTGVTIPASVTGIGDYAFSGCESLTSVTIPASVTSIGFWAFYGCTGLTNVTIPASVTSIGESAFRNCTSLTNITIPASVTSIGNNAFSGCTGLTSVTIPNSVTSIGDYAFRICTSLTNVIIPASVTSIGSYAFQNCTSLTNVIIPASVTSIGSYAFRNCTGLTSITVLPEVPPMGENGMFADTNNSLIYVPAGSADAYKSSQYWSDYADRIRTISE